IQSSTKGEFGGIGVEIMVESPGLKVITPIDDTPAFKAGVKPGDLIFAINDELIANMTANEAISKMRGAKNTKVKISIFREGKSEPIELAISRDIIKANPVKYHLYGDYAYIRVASFSEQTADGVKKAIFSLKKEIGKKEIQGYVLDLRNNPGGVLKQAAYVTDIFLNEGVIVSTKDRDGNEQMVFRASSNATVKDVPLVVLINNGSASASEIVAGALQDHKRALIVGTKSFGKGSVQTVISLPGYGAIKITTALYYTPSGRSIQAEGIVPDVIVDQGRVEFPKDNKKYQYSESSLRNHLENKTRNDSENIKENSKAEFWAKLYEQDYQLARSIDILKSLILLKKW
ncbi:MAG: S41 family peptidase, partial [Pseudomonadota bacterium]